MPRNHEMRRFKRVRENVKLKIDCIEISALSALFEVGITANISASGLLFRYDKPIKIGQAFHISFLSPNSFEMFSLDALVVRIEIILDNQYDIGVSFLNMTENDQKRLNYYLTHE